MHLEQQLEVCSVSPKSDLNDEVLERTVKSSGILLEHQTEKIVREVLVDFTPSGRVPTTQIGKAVSGVVHSLSGPEEKVSEIDVYAKGSISVEMLDLYIAGEFRGPVVRARVYQNVLIECKGHRSDGFLLFRSTEPPNGFAFPLVVHQSLSPERRTDTPPFGTKSLTIPEELLFGDWANFYQGEISKEVYKQDSDSRNKFMRAVEQLNWSARNLLLCRDEWNEDYIVQEAGKNFYQFVSIMVTNAPLLALRIGDDSTCIAKDVPWFVFNNANGLLNPVFFNSDVPFLHYHYVVNKDYLADFLSQMLSVVQTERLPGYSENLNWDLEVAND